jgi:hypothetical protein
MSKRLQARPVMLLHKCLDPREVPFLQRSKDRPMLARNDDFGHLEAYIAVKLHCERTVDVL